MLIDFNWVLFDEVASSDVDSDSGCVGRGGGGVRRRQDIDDDGK